VAEDLSALASHLVELAESSDSRHVMWLNRNVTKNRMAAADLEPRLSAYLAGEDSPADRVQR